jgi:hypothetical protein
LWDEAQSRFNVVDAEYDRRIAAEEAASEAVHDECPRVDRFFDEYGLGMSMTRERAIRAITWRCCQREHVSAMILYPPDKRDLNDEKLDAINAEADRVADEFMAFQARHDEAWERHGVDKLAARVAEYRELYFEARDDLMAVPAPDVEAVLTKFQIAATYVDHAYVDSAVADACRFLGAVH